MTGSKPSFFRKYAVERPAIPPPKIATLRSKFKTSNLYFLLKKKVKQRKPLS
jgi:hypothetical protein